MLITDLFFHERLDELTAAASRTDRTRLIGSFASRSANPFVRNAHDSGYESGSDDLKPNLGFRHREIKPLLRIIRSSARPCSV